MLSYLPKVTSENNIYTVSVQSVEFMPISFTSISLKCICHLLKLTPSIQFNNLLFQSNQLQLRNKNVKRSASIDKLGKKQV